MVDDDETHKIQLASVELEPRRISATGTTHLWELIGYVAFSGAKIEIP